MPGDNGSHYEVGEVDIDTTVDGVSHGQSSDGDSLDDGFRVDAIREGFAAFTWDDAIQHVTTHASRNADVINNFQVGHDMINFEGALVNSTAVGDVDRVEADRFVSRSWGTTLDLDTTEFGIVSAEANDHGSSVDAANLTDAHDIAELLSSVFHFEAEGGDDDLNTTIFAITAADDRSSTAIWVHSQSTVDDRTIEASELTLLAIVHTTGGEFGAENLQMLQYQGGWSPMP